MWPRFKKLMVTAVADSDDAGKYNIGTVCVIVYAGEPYQPASKSPPGRKRTARSPNTMNGGNAGLLSLLMIYVICN